MPGRKKKIGIPRAVSNDSIRVAKSDGEVKLFAKFNHKWYSTPLADAFSIRNKNQARKHSILTYNNGAGELNPAITAHPNGKLYLRNNKGTSKVLLKNDEGVLKIRNSLDDEDAVINVKSFGISAAGAEIGGALGYDDDIFIGHGLGMSIQSAHVTDGVFNATCDPDGTSSANIVVSSADKRIKVGQYVKATNGTPKSGKVPYVGAIAESGGTGTGVTSFTLYRDGASVNAADEDAETWTFYPHFPVVYHAASEYDDAYVKHQITSLNHWLAGASFYRGTVDGSGNITSNAPYEITSSSTNFLASAPEFSLTQTGALELFGTSASLKVSYDATNYAALTVAADGATTLTTVDADAAVAHLNIQPDGHVALKKGTGFSITTVTYGDIVTGASASIGNNTDVDFRLGNKAKLTLTATPTQILGFVFPAVSGNFSLILTQDGTGTRLVTAYNAYSSSTADATGSATLLWAGGSNPTLTTTSGKSDIISIYWDQGAQKAYATITHNF